MQLVYVTVRCPLGDKKEKKNVEKKYLLLQDLAKVYIFLGS